MGKCKRHTPKPKEELKILNHVKPTPMDLIANVAAITQVKKEPADDDIEMTQAINAAPIDLLAAAAKVKEEPMED